MVQHPFRRKSPYLEPSATEGESPEAAEPQQDINISELPYSPLTQKKEASVLPKEKPANELAPAAKPLAPKGSKLTWKEKLERFSDDTWMDAMAQNPRMEKFIAWVDRVGSFMVKREYHTGNPAIDAVRGPVVFGLWLFLFVFVFLFGWSLLAPLSSAAVAQGAVVLDTHKKVIQHLEGGIIEDILVKEGEHVESGQPLIRLNETNAKARQEILLGQYRTAKATEARLIAERDGKTEMEFPEELVEQANDPSVANLLASQQQLFEARTKTLNGQMDVYSQRIHQLEDEIKGFEAQQSAAKKQINLINQEIETVSALVEKGQALKPRLLALQRAEAQLAGERGQHLSDIARAKQTIGENKLEMITLKNKYLSDVVGQLRETQDNVADLGEKLRASEDVLSRVTITAPQSGIVNNIRFHTKGGVIQPGTPIMDLVPQDEKLIIEAQVSPQDIDVVHQGLKARVRLSAYKSRTTPLIDGVVDTVSADRIVDEKSGGAFYIARITVDDKELSALKNVELYPGMPADVLIITGERTMFSYLTTPLMQGFFNAFREQ